MLQIIWHVCGKCMPRAINMQYFRMIFVRAICVFYFCGIEMTSLNLDYV